uniref:BAG family molecular chaperone regulator 5, mitochondrial-like n=1 Tax=Erigeron canadensis TaxID=72917 RepID=UPI001CB8EB0D|nr:BAG family molecular chaperone regulator 5, mitochondrial-like [Erigeron canadensis]
MKKGAINKNKHYSKPQQSTSSRRRVTWPKVVNSVPVRKQIFSKGLAALKIQKVFRGFLVRKSVNKISSVKNAVVKLEQRINNTEFINSIRKDDKERLRLNETIMSLLFKLDSVRGVDFGVRRTNNNETDTEASSQELMSKFNDRE